jgi:hypothetical protein
MKKALAACAAVIGVIGTVVGIAVGLRNLGVFPSTTSTAYNPSTASPADFVGQWGGFEGSNSIDQAPRRIRMTITRDGSVLHVAIYYQVGNNQLSSTPEDTTGIVSAGQVTLYFTLSLYNGNFQQVGTLYSYEWHLTIPRPGTLHFTLHTRSLGLPDTDTSGDLRHP